MTQISGQRKFSKDEMEEEAVGSFSQNLTVMQRAGLFQSSPAVKALSHPGRLKASCDLQEKK